MDSREAEKLLISLKNPKYVKRAWIEGGFFYPSENCISLEKTLKFRHNDLRAAREQEEPWNQIAFFCPTHKGDTRPCPRYLLLLFTGNGKYISCVMTKRGPWRTSKLFVFNQAHHTGLLKQAWRHGWSIICAFIRHFDMSVLEKLVH